MATSVTWVTHATGLSEALVFPSMDWRYLAPVLSGKEGFEGGSQPAQISLDQVRQGWVLVHRNTRQGSLMFPELEIAYLLADTGAGFCP